MSEESIPAYQLEKVSREAERLAILLTEGTPVSLDYDPGNGSTYPLLLVPIPHAIGPHLGLGLNKDTYLLHSVLDGKCIMFDLVYEKIPSQHELSHHLGIDEKGAGAVRYLACEIAHYRR